MQNDTSKPDPYKVFKAIAQIISEKEEAKVTLKSVTIKDKQKASA